MILLSSAQSNVVWPLLACLVCLQAAFVVGRWSRSPTTLLRSFATRIEPSLKSSDGESAVCGFQGLARRAPKDLVTLEPAAPPRHESSLSVSVWSRYFKSSFCCNARRTESGTNSSQGFLGRSHIQELPACLSEAHGEISLSAGQG